MGAGGVAPPAPVPPPRTPHDQLHHPPPPTHPPDGVPRTVVPVLPVFHAPGGSGPPHRGRRRPQHRRRRDRARQRALWPRRPNNRAVQGLLGAHHPVGPGRIVPHAPERQRNPRREGGQQCPPRHLGDHHRDHHRHLGRVAVGHTPVLDRRSRHDHPHRRRVRDTRVRARLRAPMALRRAAQQVGLARVGAPAHPRYRARLVGVVLHPDRRAVALPDIARDHPRVRVHRSGGAHDAWLDARGSARRLHAYRSGQGTDRTKRRLQARPPQRDVAGRDAHRDRLRHGHRRCGTHRDDLLVAGARIGDRQLRHAARPTGRARAHPGGRDRVRLDQPAGRRLLRLVRPAHPTRKRGPDMTIVEPGVPATVTGVPAPVGAEDLGEARPLRADVWRRFKSNRLAMGGLVFIVAIASVFGRSENAIILVLGLTGWLAVARIVRASFLSLKRLEYVEAATALGFSRRRIMYRHILPNALQPIIVIGTIAVGYVILAEAALSFLSVGPQPPTPAWGLMVADGKGALTSAPHLLFFPGAAIFLTVLAFVFVGDGLRDALDPKLK